MFERDISELRYFVYAVALRPHRQNIASFPPFPGEGGTGGMG